MELIKIERNEKNEQVVSARDLHKKLGIKSRFNDWIKNRINEYGFVENTDFVLISRKKRTAQGNETIYTDYIISIEMVKQICLKNKRSKNAGCIYNQLGGDVTHIHTHTRFEIAFGDMLTEALNEIDLEVIPQYNVDGYRIDFYIPSLNIAVEYDEEHHYKLENQKKDSQRQAYIENKIGAKFIRCDYRDSDIKNVMKVLKEIM